MDKTLIVIAKALDAAREGVEYSPKHGALCPFCGLKTRVQTTKPWLGNSRLRYHRCENPQCPLCVLGERVRSWEESLPDHGKKA